MARFENKVIAITGAGSGIGLELAKVLAGQGATLSLADNRIDALEAAGNLIGQTGCAYLTTVVDVQKRRDVEEWIRRTIERYKRVDGAANLAGVIGSSMGTKTIAEFDDDEEWNFVMGVNCTGV